jgi:FkbM family methyltransferase
MLKRLVSLAATRLGYTIIPTWRLETDPCARYLKRLFDLLSIDLVIDVGANAGQFRNLLRDQVGYEGRIVSFEPVPHLSRALAARAVADPLWTVDARALGASAGTLNLNLMQDTQFSSFLSPRHDAIPRYEDKNVVREHVAVEVTTLDLVMPALNASFSPRAIYLKIDTQGFDLETIKGGEQSLDRVVAMQFEAAVRPIYEGAPGYRDIIDHLTPRGFVESEFFANNEGAFPQLVEFDCFMIRRNMIPGQQTG